MARKRYIKMTSAAGIRAAVLKSGYYLSGIKGDMLDCLAIKYGLYRFKGETDTCFRKRILPKWIVEHIGKGAKGDV